MWRAANVISVLGIAAWLGWIAGGASIPLMLFSASATTNVVTNCVVTDGDTVRCNGERIRLLGIDTPELPGHCRIGRHCVPGNPYAATQSLEDALVGTIRIHRVGKDHYRRTLATLSSDKGDLSCWQLQHGQAIYKAKWDDGGLVRRTCPAVARG